MLIMKKIAILAIVVATLVGCGLPQNRENQQRTIFVTIQPLKSIVEGVVGDDYTVQVLVPEGASPESFEPTAKQLAELGRSRWIVGVGLLDFEQNLISRLSEGCSVISLSEGVEPIAGSCSHCSHSHNHSHAHGVDPHIWTSPQSLKIMTQSFAQRVLSEYPDSLHYAENCEGLLAKIERTDSTLRARIDNSSKRQFLIYHPAFTYLARDYGIEQLSIEHEGKEPSAKRIAQIIEWAKQHGVNRVFYQSQFPASSVEVIASDIGAEAVAVNPLAEDILAEIERFTNLALE